MTFGRSCADAAAAAAAAVAAARISAARLGLGWPPGRCVSFRAPSVVVGVPIPAQQLVAWVRGGFLAGCGKRCCFGRRSKVEAWELLLADHLDLPELVR